jgi:preprotein translocase SecE subunit
MVKAKKASFLHGVRSEFKRIKWMKHSEVVKQLFTVVTIISIVALLVVVSDMLGATGFSLLTRFR